MSTADDTPKAMDTTPSLCASGCGVFGNPNTANMCSKCYKDEAAKGAKLSSPGRRRRAGRRAVGAGRPFAGGHARRARGRGAVTPAVAPAERPRGDARRAGAGGDARRARRRNGGLTPAPPAFVTPAAPVQASASAARRPPPPRKEAGVGVGRGRPAADATPTRPIQEKTNAAGPATRRSACSASSASASTCFAASTASPRRTSATSTSRRRGRSCSRSRTRRSPRRRWRRSEAGGRGFLLPPQIDRRAPGRAPREPLLSERGLLYPRLVPH